MGRPIFLGRLRASRRVDVVHKVILVASNRFNWIESKYSAAIEVSLDFDLMTTFKERP
jgi:hypothetical protein